MRETDLPSPGIGRLGLELRRVVTQVLSYMQVASVGYGGTHPSASDLSAFFLAAATALGNSPPVFVDSAGNTFTDANGNPFI